MSDNAALEAFGLKFNPFPPAATGVAFSGDMWLPADWFSEIGQRINELSTGGGSKALTIVGEYGAGKTYVLHWLMEKEFRKRRILPFFFDNPGVAFYDLANQLLRQVGRYELSKTLWELLYNPQNDPSLQGRLIDLTFPEWLERLGDRTARKREVNFLAQEMRRSGLSDEEEVSYRFAQLITDTRDSPYYEFRNFIPRNANSLIAEKEEARYFLTLLRILRKIFEVDGIAFLIDEFEDIALGKRLAKRQISEYTATLRRLLDAASAEEFWLALSITPEGLEQTYMLEPALRDRLSASFQISSLSDSDAFDLVSNRLKSAWTEETYEGIWPFQEGVISVIKPVNRSTPRKLIKVLGKALALALDGDGPPVTKLLVTKAEQLLSEAS